MADIPGNNEPNSRPNHLIRRLFVTDKDGVEHEIRTKAQFDRIVAQMTPQQYEDFKTRYRFCSVQNLTGIPDYTGSVWDLL